MSDPQNSFRRDQGKASSSNVAAGQPSAFAQPRWQDPFHGHAQSQSHVVSDQASAFSPPPYSVDYRPQIQMEPYRGFDAQSYHHNQPPDHPTFEPSEPPMPFLRGASYGPSPPPRPAGVPPLHADQGPAEHSSRYGPPTSSQATHNNGRTASQIAPPVPYPSRSTMGNATYTPPVGISNRRAQRARRSRRHLNAQPNVHGQGARSIPQMSPVEGPNDSMAGVNVPVAPASAVAQSHDYYFPSFFGEFVMDQDRVPGPDMDQLFAQAFDQPFFQNPPHHPARTTSSNAPVPTSTSGMPPDVRQHADEPPPRSQEASFSAHGTWAPVPGVSTDYTSGHGLMPVGVSDLTYQQAADNHMRQFYESLLARDFVGGPPEYAGANVTADQNAAGEDSAAARARREEMVARRRRELRQMRLGARQSTKRPPPAQVKRFIMLPAADKAHDGECPICQEPYDDDEHPAIQLQNVACTHIFGRGCLQEWCNSGMDNAHKCPSCRQSLDGALDSLSLRRPRSPPDFGMPARPGASRRDLGGYERTFDAEVRALEVDAMLARRFQRPEGMDPARWNAHVQQLQGQVLTPRPPTLSFGLAPPSPERSVDRTPVQTSALARDRTQSRAELTEERVQRVMTFQRHQLSRFDADATRRIATAQATGLREAHALAAQITEERTALVARHDYQLRIARGP